MSRADVSHRDDLTRALEENLWEAWSVFGRGPGCALHDTDDLLWFETPIPIVPYNGVLRCRLRSNVHQAIAGIVEHFAHKKAQFMWIVHPSSSPLDLRNRLLSRGLNDIEPVHGMCRSLDDLPPVPNLPEGLEIRKIDSEREASAFYQFAAWRWSVPDEFTEQHAAITSEFQIGRPGSRMHMWQAWREGNPVAKAGMYLGSGSAGIYGVVTRPEARKLGLASVLTLTALHEARSLGSRLAVLHSSPMAQSLYRSLGFETTAEFRLFASDEVHV